MSLPYRFQLGEREGMGTAVADRTITFFIPKKTKRRKPNEGQGYCQQLLEKFSKLEFFSLWLNEVLMQKAMQKNPLNHLKVSKYLEVCYNFN